MESVGINLNKAKIKRQTFLKNPIITLEMSENNELCS